MKKVLIVGSEGNMGKRYQAILKHLKVPYDCFDSKLKGTFHFKNVEGIIIATPTPTHEETILEFLKKDVPILCEKPITKSLRNLKVLLGEANGRLSMVNQYSFLPQIAVARTRNELTVYDYFKHGGDGINWDCIQILGLSNGEVVLKEESPIWKCQINGVEIDLCDMDESYIHMVHYWMEGYRMSTADILSSHQKAYDYPINRSNQH